VTDPDDARPDPAVPSARAVLSDRSPVLFLVAVTATTMASIAQVTALGFQVFELTGRELDLGLLGLAEFVPALLLAVPTGALADRFDRRLMMGIGLGGELLCALVLAWLTARGVTTFTPLLVVVVAFGVCRAVAAPAARALPATLVAPEALPRIVPLFSATWQFGLIVGPVLGGLLYAFRPPAAYLGTAALLAVGICVLPFVRLHPSVPPRVGAGRARPSWSEALDGIRVIRRTPVLFGAISLDLFAVLFGGAVALLPAIAQDRLGVGAAGLGWLRAAGGIGAALTTVVLATRPVTHRIGRVLLASVAVFGVATVALGLTTSYWVAFAALAVLSGADAISVYVRATLVPLITADEYRGRVLAVENVFIGASNELGAFESGVAGQLLGAPAAIVLGGAATLAVVVIWWFRFPALRDIDRFDDITPGSARPERGEDP
jgi:MFS family permease